jgi:predicted amidohydrolase YtcJ
MYEMGTVFRSGRFFTVPSERSIQTGEFEFAECMIVKDGIIAYIGSSQDYEVHQAINAGAQVHDMSQRIVLPGFTDGHMHLLLLALALKKIELGSCKTLEDIRNVISGAAKAYPHLARLQCKGWMHSMTDGKALASMLDDLDPRPIFIDSKDLHHAWCNNAALSEMGVQDMLDPTGGRIHRDTEGKASGLLDDAATFSIVWPHIARVASMEEKLDGFRKVLSNYSAAGYTGVIDMAMDMNSWEALQVLQEQDGELFVRIAAHWLIVPSETEEANLKQVDKAIELYKQFNTETNANFRIVGIKVMCDGIIDACTAALCEPYSNGNTSSLIWSAEMLGPVIKKADDAGMQCAIHAIGDQAIKTAIDVLEEHGTPGRRHRIEHLELASPEDAKRLGQLGITASIQPVHADPAILRAWPKLLGEHRCGRAFAYKEFQDGGARLALGSDAPTASSNPLNNLYVATTRRSAREPESIERVNKHFALGLASAVSAATIGSAYSCFADSWTGRLAKGMKADFVVVDMEWDAESLLSARVHETWFEGRKVFDAKQVELGENENVRQFGRTVYFDALRG